MQPVLAAAVEAIRAAFISDTLARFDKVRDQLEQQQKEQQQDEQQEQQKRTIKLTPAQLPPFLVGLGSVAGAGKSTFAQRVAEALRRMDNNQNINNNVSTKVHVKSCTVLPFDGYHLYRSALQAMPEPDRERAFRCRGAPWTFDPLKYLRDIQQLKSTGKLSAPGFDHAKKDPEEGVYDVDASEPYSSATSSTTTIHRDIVIVEGIYVLFADESNKAWTAARSLYDLHIYLRIPIDLATERLTRRHMAAWGISEEEARARASGSDRDNGLLVIAAAEKILDKCVVLDSVEDVQFAQS